MIDSVWNGVIVAALLFGLTAVFAAALLLARRARSVPKTRYPRGREVSPPARASRSGG